MISIESYMQVNSIEIIFDSEGIEEMIRYLNFIKKNAESMHLDIESMHLNGGNELEEVPIAGGGYSIPHAKIVFLSPGCL